MKCLTSPEKWQQLRFKTRPAPSPHAPPPPTGTDASQFAGRRSGGSGEMGEGGGWGGKQTPIGLRLHYVKAEEPSLKPYEW